MSPRDGNRWFCAGCVEYGHYVGTIEPTSPSHPQFYRDLDSLARAEELLPGNAVEYSPYGTRDTEYMGTIDVVELRTYRGAECLTVVIRQDDDGPFTSVERQLPLSEFRDIVADLAGPHDRDIPMDEELLLVI